MPNLCIGTDAATIGFRSDQRRYRFGLWLSGKPAQLRLLWQEVTKNADPRVTGALGSCH
jgi:hypothetical protein